MSDPLVLEKNNGGNSKIFLIIGLVILLIIGGTCGFLFLTPAGKALMGKETATEDGEEKKFDIQNISFTSLPEILLNLRSNDGRQVFLKDHTLLRDIFHKCAENASK